MSIIPLAVPSLRGNELKYVTECINTEWVSSAGAYVNKFAEDIAGYVAVKHAVSTSSGTAALHTSLILSGIGDGDEVIVPTITFIAPVNTVRYVGADPVFMDCDEYLNIDPEKIADFCDKECAFEGGTLINNATGKKVKAIIPVHIFGHPVNIGPIIRVAEKYNLKVIEDATESLGSYYKEDGRKTGTIGDMGCYSFNGNKIITTGGGGMIVTNSEKDAKKAAYLTNQAKDDTIKYIHNEIGYNYRMNNVQAAIGCAQLENLDNYITIKRKNFVLYKNYLSGVDGISLIDEPDYAFSNFWYYSLVINEAEYGMDRDSLMEKLNEHGVQTRPLWQLNHKQAPYEKCQSYKIEKAGMYYDKVLNIPCSVNLQEDQIKKVVKVIKDE